MSSQKKTTKRTPEERAEIARRNGAKSKGPVTEEGKAASSQNATTHGIYTKNIVLSNESTGLYHHLLNEYMAEWSPVGVREGDLVLDIIQARWRMSRIMCMETAAIELQMARERAAVDGEFEVLGEDMRTSLALTGIAEKAIAKMDFPGRAEARFQRIIGRATTELERMQARRRADQTPASTDSAGSDTAPAPGKASGGNCWKEISTPFNTGKQLRPAAQLRARPAKEKCGNEPSCRGRRPPVRTSTISRQNCSRIAEVHARLKDRRRTTTRMRSASRPPTTPPQQARLASRGFHYPAPAKGLGR
ncbi:MAG: hypothetical protein SGI92_05185 [Bryobacteraceae bacterium]|nr:hypothetical protein [Bryobacteraceae bacterium]